MNLQTLRSTSRIHSLKPAEQDRPRRNSAIPRLRSVFLAAVFSIGLHPAATAQDEAAQQAAIDAFYPVMIQAVNEGRLDAARELCQKAIAWQPRNPAHFYNLGCIESKAGNADKAITALNQAVQCGYADTESLGNDPDLAAIRTDKRFNDVMFIAAKNAINRKAQTTPAQPGAMPATPKPATPKPAAPKPAAAPAPAPAVAGPSGPETAPAPAQLTARGPIGLYFMTRYWSASQTLEKAAWYFAPDGTAYENPTGGFSAAELAAHPGRKGTLRLEGKKLTLTVTGGRDQGKEQYGDYEPEAATHSFYWDMGSFIPVKGFIRTATLAGTYEGGFSSSTSGTSGRVARTLTLNADGTFSLTGAASASASDSQGTAKIGAYGSLSSGTWKASPYSLTLADASGRSKRSVAFPRDDEKTPVNPDEFYFDGILWTRKK